MVAKCASVVLCAAMLFSAAFAQESQKPPAVSLEPLTAEQLSVYRAVLLGWIDRDTSQVNLAIRTVPLEATDSASNPSGSAGCGKGLELEPSSALVHEFHAADLAQLGSDKVRLVDPKRGEEDVRKNDPEHAIRDRGSIEAALRNAFAHGLFTLSEIRFDKSHSHAVVSFGFVCGGLCGNGATVTLEKTEVGWRRSEMCSSWISRLEPNTGGTFDSGE